MPTTTISIPLSIAEWNVVLSALSTRPWREVDPIIRQIHKAAEEAAKAGVTSPSVVDDDGEEEAAN